MKGVMHNNPASITGIILLLNMPLVYAEKTKVLIFGGSEGDVYLGCLNCSPYDIDSVNYAYGRYGSFNSKISILNPKGLYGSATSRYSPCNPNATFPPVLKNENGETFGRLVLGAEHYQANDNTKVQQWLSEYVCRQEQGPE